MIPTRLGWILAALLAVSALCLTPASAERLMRYDRTTGAVTEYQAACTTYAPGDTTYTAANSTTLAYWCSTGLYTINLATGAATRVSNDVALSGANFRISDQYLTWNGKLLNLSTGSTGTISTNARLYGGYAAYNSGTDYIVENLATESKKTISTPKSTTLVGMTSRSIVIMDSDNFSSADQMWTMHFSEYSSTTGSATGWTHSVTSNINDPTGANCRVSDSWFFDTGGDDTGEPIYDSGKLGDSTGSSSRNFEFAGEPCVYSNTIAFLGDAYAIKTLSLDSDEIHAPYGESGTPDLHIWGLGINSSYITWFDNTVPEPSSLLALAGLMGSAAIFVRRRAR